MVESDHWFYLVLQKEVNYVVVVTDSCLVDVVVGTTREDSGPGQGKAVEIDILFFQKVYVFFPEMIGVASYVPS